MAYKISGVITHDGRVIVIRKDNYTIESNTLISGTIDPGGYFSYEITGLDNTEKIALGRRNSDGWAIGHSVNPTEYGAPAGTLWAWGRNNYGDLGLGDIIPRSSPVQVGGLIDWSNVVQGTGGHSYAIKTDGTLWTWGDNQQGQLGQGDVINKSSPIQVGALTDWDVLTVNLGDHNMVVKNNKLWVWGSNFSGELGFGDENHRSSPTQVGSLVDWEQGSFGWYNSVAVKTDGTLWTCGQNAYGALGNGEYGPSYHRSSPIQVGFDTDWDSCLGGVNNAFAFKTNGTLWGWGRNHYGQLGLADIVDRSVPTQIGGINDYVSLSTNGWNNAALKSNGTLWMWGRNQNGELGLGNTTSYSSPVQIGALTDWNKVVLSVSTAAIKSDGTLWMWGYNVYGNLGLGNTTNYSSPVQVGSDTNWIDVAPCSFHTLGIKQ